MLVVINDWQISWLYDDYWLLFYNNYVLKLNKDKIFYIYIYVNYIIITNCDKMKN